MSRQKLKEMYYYAWDTFYKGTSSRLKMGELFKKVISKEMADGTYRRFEPKKRRRFHRIGIES
jgi:hypothetical protein